MAMIFWNVEVLLVEYVVKGITIIKTEVYREKTSALLETRDMLFHDICRVHKESSAQSIIEEYGCTKLPYPPYSQT